MSHNACAYDVAFFETGQCCTLMYEFRSLHVIGKSSYAMAYAFC
jgi:hypothetical protein